MGLTPHICALGTWSSQGQTSGGGMGHDFIYNYSYMLGIAKGVFAMERYVRG